jgi:hypothetical protein
MKRDTHSTRSIAVYLVISALLVVPAMALLVDGLAQGYGVAAAQTQTGAATQLAKSSTAR